VRVTSLLGRTGTALITDMEQPLGNAVGNALEIREAIECLKGNGPGDLVEITLELGIEMLSLALIEADRARARSLLEKLLSGGAALEKFVQFVEAQGGDAGVVDDLSLLPRASSVEMITAPRPGHVGQIDARALGEVCVDMGGGRRKRNDEIDGAVGLVLKAKVGDRVEKGSPLAEVHYEKSGTGATGGEVLERVKQAFTLTAEPVPKRELILRRLPGP